MSRKNKNKPFLENIVIEAVAAEGNALAHINGKVLFVPKVIPGDVIDVQVNKVRKGYMEGYMVRMVTPSPFRLEPFCEHYPVCGGCKWQPLPYKMQLEYKQQQVYDQLKRIGHLQLPEILPIIGSDKTEFYRNKLEYTFSNKRWLLDGENPESLSAQERLGLGFHVGGFFDKVLDIKRCNLQSEPSNSIRLFIRNYAIEKGLDFFDLREQSGFMRTLIIRTASTGEVMITLVFGTDAVGKNLNEEKIIDGQIKDLLVAVKEHFPQITSLYYIINSKKNDTINDLECVLFSGRECIYEKMEDLKFKIGPKSFYQTNSEQAYKLYSIVRKFAFGDDWRGCNAKPPVIYDLYTGTGTIALFLAKNAEKVIGIEYVPEAIEDAKANAIENGISNCSFFSGDMKDILNEEFIREQGVPDLVVLDPPRAGIHPDVAKILMDTSPSRIIYVSCNPASQARDLSVFSQKYSIEAVQPVDMFPHTHHTENVVYLKNIKNHVEKY